MTVPAEAIAAAAAVLHDDYCDDGDTRTCGRWNSKVPGGYDPRKHVGFYEDRAREVLVAAVPFLAEDGWDAARDRATEANQARRDERERCAQLAERHKAQYWAHKDAQGTYHPFADLIREEAADAAA